MMATAGTTSDSAAAGNTRSQAAWVLLFVLIGIVIVLGAGWYGYRSGFDGNLPTPQTPAVAASASESNTAATAAPPIESGATRVGGERSATADATRQLRWPLWDFQLGQPIPPRDPPLTPPGWRLLGATMTREGWKVAVLRQDTRQPEFLGLGATLPGGYVIKAISDEDVTLVIDKREVVLSYTGSR